MENEANLTAHFMRRFYQKRPTICNSAICSLPMLYPRQRFFEYRQRFIDIGFAVGK
jgi:hypothetical protein